MSPNACDAAYNAATNNVTDVIRESHQQAGRRRAPNFRQGIGWAEILQRLGDVDADISPTMFIHSRCARLAECLPALQHDPNRPEDVLKVDADEAGIGGDDAADTLRYLVATKARTLAQRRLRGM